MKGAKVDVLKIEDGGEIFAGCAIVVEIPVMRSGSIVEVAVSAKGDQMIRINGFDVLADFIGPGRQDLAAVAFGFGTSSLQAGQAIIEKRDIIHIVPRWQAPTRRLQESLCTL